MSDLAEPWRLPECGLEGVWFVHTGRLRIDDLVRCGPGGIIPCRGLPAVQYVPPAVDSYDRLAGMISDAA